MRTKNRVCPKMMLLLGLLAGMLVSGVESADSAPSYAVAPADQGGVALHPGALALDPRVLRIRFDTRANDAAGMPSDGYRWESQTGGDFSFDLVAGGAPVAGRAVPVGAVVAAPHAVPVQAPAAHVAAIPEPSGGMCLGLGVVLLCGSVWRKTRKKTINL
jgi:hypothetical protein